MRTRDVGLLLLRVTVGATLAAHGTQKLFGWFGGPGREGAAQAFRAMGFPRHEEAVLAASACELGGGVLLAAGLATPAAGAAALGAMRVAGDVHRPNGFFAQQGGFEYPMALGVASAALALTGPGTLSLDELLGHRLARPWMAYAGCAAALVAGTAVARSRRPAPEPVLDVREQEGDVAVPERGEAEVVS